MKDLTADKWIKGHHAYIGDPKTPQYLLSGRELDEFLCHFTLNHTECNCYFNGSCAHEDAPSPGHSQCVGTLNCIESSYGDVEISETEKTNIEQYDCGCVSRIDDHGFHVIEWCPLHKAASGLYDACKAFREATTTDLAESVKEVALIDKALAEAEKEGQHGKSRQQSNKVTS